MNLLNKMLKTIAIIGIFLASSCSTVNNYLGKKSIDSCPYLLDDQIFDHRTSEDMNIDSMKSAVVYEKYINGLILSDINNLLSDIKAKSASAEYIKNLKLNIKNIIRSEITIHRGLANYLKTVDGKEFGDNEGKINFISIIENSVIPNLEYSVELFSKHSEIFLSGELPESIVVDGELVYLCSKNLNMISGTKRLNSLAYLLYIIKNNLYGDLGIKAHNDKFVNKSYLAKYIPLPKKFIVSDAFHDIEKSIFLMKTSKNANSRYAMITLSSGYHEAFNISRSFNPEVSSEAKYIPWYSAIFNVDPFVTQDMMLAFYRIKYEYDYINAGIVNKLNYYNQFIDNFEPIDLKNPKKQIKAGQLVLVKNFIKTSIDLSDVINGTAGTLGLIMDYDYQNKTIIVFTDKVNTFGGWKSGVGFDVISIDPSFANSRSIFVFNPKKNAIKDIRIAMGMLIPSKVSHEGASNIELLEKLSSMDQDVTGVASEVLNSTNSKSSEYMMLPDKAIQKSQIKIEKNAVIEKAYPVAQNTITATTNNLLIKKK